MKWQAIWTVSKNRDLIFGLHHWPKATAGILLLLLAIPHLVAQSIAPNPVMICKGQTIDFQLSGVAAATANSAMWDDGGKGGAFNPTSGSTTTYTPASGQATDKIEIKTFQPAPAGAAAGTKGPVIASGTLFFYQEQKQCTRLGGELVRATVGFEQVGAAGTDSSQKFSFDFFISRPVPIHIHRNNSVAGQLFGPRFRWWGDVRLGSFPQQVNTDILTFSSNFASNAGKLPVNQLVQTAEFVTGPEFRVSSFNRGRGSISDSSDQVFALTLFGGGGAIGPFSPGQNSTVFQVPATTTQQYLALCQQFPNQFPDPAPGVSCGTRSVTPSSTPAQFVAFVPQTHDRFPRKWLVGTRLYTFYTQAGPQGELLHSAPAMVDFGLGQSELVTNGKLGGIVGFFSAAYPFPMGKRTDPKTVVVYLFGEATPAFVRPTLTSSPGVTAPVNPNTPIFLSPAVDSNGSAIPLTNPNVLAITVPSNNRDTYRIGAALDLVAVWNRLVSK